MAEAVMVEETHSRASVQDGVVMDAGVADLVANEIMERLKAFDAAIEANKILEIDGLAIDGTPCDEITRESRVKVLNHKSELAYEVEIDTIIQTPLEDLMAALITGELVKCYGITRIN